jgi:hypothetical protein
MTVVAVVVATVVILVAVAMFANMVSGTGYNTRSHKSY